MVADLKALHLQFQLRERFCILYGQLLTFYFNIRMACAPKLNSTHIYYFYSTQKYALNESVYKSLLL